MERLTVEYLEKKNACQEGIDFVVRNDLEGFPLDRLNEVKGDYDYFINWLQEAIDNDETWDYEYDAAGNVIKKTLVGGYSMCRVEVSDKVVKNVVTMMPHCHQYEYDVFGNMVKHLFPSGRVCFYEYDSYGNMVKEIYPGGKVTEYDYDDLGNMVKEIYSNDDVTDYEYDDLGNVIKEVDSDGDFTEWSYGRSAAGDFTVKQGGEVILTVPKF